MADGKRAPRVLGWIAVSLTICLVVALLVLRLSGFREAPNPEGGLPDSVAITFLISTVFGLVFVPLSIVAGALGGRAVLLLAVALYAAAWLIVPKFNLIDAYIYTFGGSGDPDSGRIFFLVIMTLFCVLPFLGVLLGYNTSRR